MNYDQLDFEGYELDTENSDFLCGTVHKTMMLRKLDDRINIYE